MVKIIHTSDWHLGKKLHRFSRREDLQAVMDHFIQTVQKQQINIFIIAGDIFDQFRPDYDALNDLLSFLKKLIELECYPVLITGNHDSNNLLDALNSYLKKDQITIFSNLSIENEKIIEIDRKKILLKGLPYFKENQLQEYYLKNQQIHDLEKHKNEDFPDNEELLREYARIKSKESYDFSIFIGHHLFSKYELSGSEDSVFLSGLESINYKSFGPFNYFAFGHIHKYQKLSANAFYCGSPIAINFGEPQKKFFNLLESDESNNSFHISKCEIPCFRQLFYIKDYGHQILDKIHALPKIPKTELNGLAEIMVTLKEPDPGLQDRINELLKEKNIVPINFIPFLEADETFYSQAEYERLYSLNIDSLFQEYFLSKYPEIKEVPVTYMQKFNDLKQGIDEI